MLSTPDKEFDWTEFVELYGSQLYNYFLRAGFRREMAQELTQEVFLRFLKKLQTEIFDPSKGSEAAFCFGIARFVALENTQYKLSFDMPLHNDPMSQNQDEVLELLNQSNDSCAPCELNSLEAGIASKEKMQSLQKALAQLSPIQQELVNLYMVEGMDLNELASVTNIPLGTIKSHLFRAKEKLKSILSKGITHV